MGPFESNLAGRYVAICIQQTKNKLFTSHFLLRSLCHTDNLTRPINGPHQSDMVALRRPPRHGRRDYTQHPRILVRLPPPITTTTLSLTSHFPQRPRSQIHRVRTTFPLYPTSTSHKTPRAHPRQARGSFPSALRSRDVGDPCTRCSVYDTLCLQVKQIRVIGSGN